jgi:hypothetical protein
MSNMSITVSYADFQRSFKGSRATTEAVVAAQGAARLRVSLDVSSELLFGSIGQKGLRDILGLYYQDRNLGSRTLGVARQDRHSTLLDDY